VNPKGVATKTTTDPTVVIKEYENCEYSVFNL